MIYGPFTIWPPHVCFNNHAQQEFFSFKKHNLGLAAGEHLANLACQERLARARWAVQQNTLDVLHPELFNHLQTPQKTN
jgi:hypothetical protein